MYMGKCNGLYSESFTCGSVRRKRLFMLYYVEYLCLKNRINGGDEKWI